MKSWLGMTKTSLAGDVSNPDDEHPGAANIRRHTTKPSARKKPSRSKKVPISRRKKEKPMRVRKD